MATEFAHELEEELRECKTALQGQAEAMVELLLQFETRLQARLDAAEARIAAMRESGQADSLAGRLGTPGRAPEIPRDAVTRSRAN